MNTQEFVDNYFIELFDAINPELKPDEDTENLTDAELLEKLLG